MIKLTLLTKDGKVVTEHDEESITLKDVALILFEFERIKKSLLEIEFDPEFEITNEGA